MLNVKEKETPPVVGDYSTDLCKLVAKLLQKNPDDRPTIGEIMQSNFIQNAEALLADTLPIRKVPERPAPMAPPPPIPHSQPQPDSGVSSNSNSMSTLAADIQQSHTIEDSFKPALISLVDREMLTKDILSQLTIDELKQICPGPFGLQRALIKMVENFKKEKDGTLLSQLKQAIEEDNGELVESLTKDKPDQCLSWILEEEHENTALHLAARLGSVNAMKKLVKAIGGNLKTHLERLNKYGDNCLHAACFAGRLTIVDIILRHYNAKEFIDRQGQMDRTALHMASASGYQNVVAVLLQHKPELEIKTSVQDLCQTPLLIASYYGRVGIVRNLLDAGACFTAVNLHGDSALHIACVQNKLELVKLLLDKADSKGVAELLELRGYRGRTALHASAAWNRADIARILLSKGANARAKSGTVEECGDTALHLAAYYGYTDVSKVLIDADPNLVKETNENHETPLSRACFNAQLGTARLLILRGASTAAKDKWGRTALDYAKMKQKEDANNNQVNYIVQLLVGRNVQNVH